MELTNLEKSLIALAEQELDGIIIEAQDGRNEAALQRYHAVKTLVGLLDLDNCGLSAPAAQVLLRIGVDADKAVADEIQS
jgi:hypothetical protein